MYTVKVLKWTEALLRNCYMNFSSVVIDSQELAQEWTIIGENDGNILKNSSRYR